VIRIALAPYNPDWPRTFEEHRKRIAAALGPRATRIEHIGSTSVPGLAAKPVLDIVVDGVRPHEAAAREALTSAGYHLTVDEPGHCIFEPPALDVHIHLWQDPRDVERHILFRDWLREHADDCTLYEAVKRRLAERTWRSSNDYAEAKSAVVHTIMRRACGEGRGPRVDAFATLLLARLPSHARVLEIGAGEGLLAANLAAEGHDVVALDRDLRSTFPVTEVAFEDYDAPAKSFDCIVAQLVLHHAHDLQEMLEKISQLLKPHGIIAIDDYGWERSDDPAFRKDRADLHTSQTMLHALRERFTELFYADHAYFNDGAADDFLAFTWIGTLRTR
jgi:GrpB-like predicted nucleotidyltransferase (UPF0157 family)